MRSFRRLAAAATLAATTALLLLGGATAPEDTAATAAPDGTTRPCPPYLPPSICNPSHDLPGGDWPWP